MLTLKALEEGLMEKQDLDTDTDTDTECCACAVISGATKKNFFYTAK